MKIVVETYSYDPLGGSENYSARVLTELLNNKQDVIVLNVTYKTQVQMNIHNFHSLIL